MPVSNTRSLVFLIFILVSHVSDALAGHHHIKVRHGRHKRQHGESYLPASFVLDTNEEETGTWGPWSSPSSCSRSCGGGVAHQTRRCHDLSEDRTETCTGSKKRFFSCNIQNCPDPTKDFRAEQCARFNNVSVDGVVYNWSPYTGASNKCELNCMPRGERFFYRFNQSIVDGTPCTTEKNDVCVEGKCMPVGCDMMLGSKSREDKCRECGGDGSGCNTVQGLIDDDLQSGYNDILLIPEGATNIVISEIRPSNNYLAIRNASGHYYLNGNWRIDFPRSLRFAGTIFHYERRPRELLSADVINALGPISEAIYIVMLYQEKNVGVSYEYSIPKRFSLQSTADSYTWVAEDFSECSASCGGGIRSRLVRCVRRSDNEIADDNLCDQQLEPDGTEACGEEPCPPGWVLGNWGPCSKKCGPDGEQSRIVKCEQIISHGIPSLVDDYRCLDIVGPKDIEIRECNTDIACPQWHIGPWKPCDRLCGEGKERRRVTCFKKENGKIVVLPDSDCDGERPESEKDCDLRPCVAVDWVVSKWTSCDDKCGLTHETRTTRCVTLKGKVYANEKCNPDTKPELVRKCAAQEKCKYQWYASQWSKCSAKCGTGVQTRKVFCGTSLSDSDTVTKVPDEKCTLEGKYNDTQECTAEIEECKGEWFAGLWSECSKPCGGGDMTRKVICMKDNEVVPIQSNCYENDVMFTKESCNKTPCEKDETIVVDPEKSNIITKDKEECEEDEDDGFVSVAYDLHPKEPRNGSPLRLQTNSLLFDFDDLMMGDEPPSSGDGEFVPNGGDSGSGSGSGGDDDYHEGEDSGFQSSITPLYTGETESTTSSGSASTDVTGSTLTTGSTAITSTDITLLDNTKSTSSQATSDSGSKNTGATEAASSGMTTQTPKSPESPPARFPSEGDLTEKEKEKLFNRKQVKTSTTQSASTITSPSLSGSESTTTSQTSDVTTSEETETSTVSTKTSDDTEGASTSPAIDITTSEGTKSTPVPSAASVHTEGASTSEVDLSTSEGPKSTTISSSDDTEGTSISTAAGTKSTPVPSTASVYTEGASTSEVDVSTSEGPKSTTISSSDDTEGTSISTSEGTKSTPVPSTVSVPTEGTSISTSEETKSTTIPTTTSDDTDTPSSAVDDSTSEGTKSTTVLSTASVHTEGASTSEVDVSTSVGPKSTTISSSDDTEGTSISTAEGTKSTPVPSTASVHTEGASTSEVDLSTSEGPKSTTISSSDDTEGTSISTSEGTKSTPVPSTASVHTEGASTFEVDVSTSEGPKSTTISSSDDTEGTSISTSEETKSTPVPSTASVHTEGASTSEVDVSTSDGPKSTTISSSDDTEGTSISTSEGTKSTPVPSTASVHTEGASTSEVDLSTSEGPKSTTISSSDDTEGTSISTSEETKSTPVPSTASVHTEGASTSEVDVSTSEGPKSTTISSSDDTEGTSISTAEGTKSTPVPSTASVHTEGASTSEVDVSTSEGSKSTTISSSDDTEGTSISTSEGTKSTTIPTTTSDDTEETSTSSAVDVSTSEGTKSTTVLSTASVHTEGPSTYPATDASTVEGTQSTPVSTTASVYTEGATTSQAIDASTSGGTESTTISASTTLYSTTSSGSEKTESSVADTTTASSSIGITGSTSSDLTESTSLSSIASSGSTISESAGPDTTVSESSSISTETSTISSPSTDITEPISTEQTTVTGTEGTSETEFITETWETTFSGEFVTTAETDVSSETTESGITETDEDLDTTEQSHITDIWTAFSSTDRTTQRPHRKCKPRKHKKTCKFSPFGCCYDGIKAATGPFEQGCPIPKTCKEVEFGCCPDGVSPAIGPNYQGCPDSHCIETLFGCCQDNVTIAEGNDYEGCPIPCSQTEFGCCPDEKTPAAGKDNLGCCNTTKYGCCPDGIEAASGPDGKGCKREETTTVTTPGVTTPGVTTPGVTTLGVTSAEVSTTEISTPETSTATVETSEATESVTIKSTTTITTTTTEAGEDCTTSEFGCCPDGQARASGKNFEGCGVINTENCSASYFGCCEDRATAALGPDNEGCPVACESSIYGCCNDGSTPAHGPDGEGCCLATPYGCCPDNIQPAQGPDLYGCGCQYSRYLCCPDNTTTARGPNNEGCGCEYTVHGCCPNRIHPATGPNYEGCPCHSYQFGCCPDGVSIAQGPHGQGCRCENTEFKCCSDGITPAQGPNYAGCTCDSSKYGCCPDGIEEAQGESFEGCLTVVSPPGAACALEKDRGTCWNLTVKWYYDTKYGGCSRFWYGGCEGNDNRFKSQEECKDVCVEPKGRDACFLPKNPGSCESRRPTWYYDTERKQCGQFMYSGCLGNANKFKTREECEELCIIPDDVDPCEQPKETGPCQGNFTRWYFDKETSSCEQFTYGGCKANKNNFRTQISCQQQCLTPGRSRVRDVCVLEKDSGPCPGSLLRWYYDTKRKSCRQFVYGGCKGNGNKFRTYAACEQRCPVRDSCTLPREEGSCGEKLARWSFDQSENRCMPFYYTGCGGNRNSYETRDACDNDCPPKIEQDTCLLPALLGDCYNYTQRWYYDSYDQRCNRFYWGGCGGNGNNFATEESCMNRCKPSPVTQPPVIQEFRTEFCFLPEDRGPCNEESVKWFYDSRYGICEQFPYGGCQGNGNKFDTIEECESRCGNVQDLCVLPQVVGPCKGAISKYYYDSRTDQCQEFIYGGCQGNQNNFEDKKSCEQRCRKSIDVTTPVIETTTVAIESDPRSPACSEMPDAGSCTNDVTAFYYDESTGGCQAFIYSGCGGNNNRFETEEQCQRICGRFRGQDICNLRADPGPCRGAFPKFYYDPAIRGCLEFSYGGCDGNANRFTSESECESICIHRVEPPVPKSDLPTNPAKCREPVSSGFGSEGNFKRFYFDYEEQTCKAFVYTGIGGNLNRFKSLASCQETCSPRANNTNVRSRQNEDPCWQAQAQCNEIQCQYGKEQFVDRYDCTACRCVDPCRSTVCPNGTQCAVKPVRQAGGITYESDCRLTLKPGTCPIVLNSTTCEKECTSDADCFNDFKCCTNGCGSSCLEPVSTQSLTTPLPEIDIANPNFDLTTPVIEQPEEPNLKAPRGGYVIMKCVVTGNPAPVISWTKNNKYIDNTILRYTIKVDGSLQIVSLQKADRGNYTCTADNRLSAPVRIQYFLDITAPIRSRPIILGEPDYRITVSLNAPARLPCHVSGWPRPHVTWWLERTKLMPVAGHGYDMQEDFSLKIHRVTLVNLGVYTCQASNHVRRPASWSVTLQALGPVSNVNPALLNYTKYLVDPPKRPTDTHVTQASSQRLQTLSTERFSPTDPPNRRPLTPPVIPLTEIIRVPVKVKVSADGDSFPEGSDFGITCNVDGYPTPRVSWYKDDALIESSNRITITDANKIVITYAERNDSGSYRCEATNEFNSDSDTANITVAGIYIHPNCQDSPFFANCALIVKGHFCQHQYYANFCCRSCTKAGQLPSREPDINDTRRNRRSVLSFF